MPPPVACSLVYFYYNASIISGSVSGSGSARKSFANAALADIRLLGSNSRHSSRNFTVSLMSAARSSSLSGLAYEVDHWTICGKGKPVWPMVGRVHSKTAPCKAAHCFIFFCPKMVEISIMASTSSAELKNGNLCARIVSRITPTDQISILAVWAVHLRRTSGARNPLVPARFARRDGL